MLTEEKPEDFASPEQNQENGSKKKKKKKKKKNNESLPQSNEHPQPQVSSEPLVVTPISEFKSNQEDSNEPKASLDAMVSTEIENKKEAEKIEVCEEFGETGSGKIKKKKKRKSKSEKGKIGDVVVVENALNHDKEQVNSIDWGKRQKCVQDGEQSNEGNVEHAETAVQISVADREVSPVDSTIRLNNQLKGENEHNVGPAETVVQISVLDREVSQVNSEPLVVTPISEFKSNEPKPSLDATVSTELENKKEVEKMEVCEEFGETGSGKIKKKSKRKSKSEKGKIGDAVVVENALNHDKEQVISRDRGKRHKCVQDGAQSNDRNVEPAETAVQISVVDRELSQVDSTIRLNNDLNSENEHNVGPAETVVQISVLDREVSQVNSEPLVVTPISEFKSNEEAYAEFAKTQTGEIKKNKKKKKKKSVINGEESNEPKSSLDAMVSTEFENKKEVEKIEVYEEFAKTQTGEKKNKKKKKKKKKKSVINGEESNEPKPSLDVMVSTEFENKKEVEKSEIYAEFAKTQTGEKRKRESKSETGKMGEVVVVENVLNHDSEQVNERKRQKSMQDGAQSNEHNVEPAETVVQISVLDREVSQVNSEPLVVTPISEFKSNEETYAEFAKTQTGEIKKNKKKKKKKSVINGEESNEPKPSLDAMVSTEFENKKEVEKSEVYAEFAKTQTGEKRKRKSKSETGKMGEVVVVENVLNHDSEQVNERKRQKSMQDGAQSNEHNVEPVETVVQISVVEREVSPVDPTIRLNNQPANLVEQKDERKIRHEKHLELIKLQKLVEEERKRLTKENVLNNDSEQVNEIVRRKRQTNVQDGTQSNEHNVEPAETVVQISVADREVSPVDPTIQLNNQPANLVEQKDMTKIREKKPKISEEERKIRHEKHSELLKMHKIVKEERKRLAKEIEGPLTRMKTMRINQALESLMIEIKEGRYPSKDESKKMRKKGVDILSNRLSVWDERNKTKMQAESKDELKSTGEEKTKMQAESKDELKSTGEEKNKVQAESKDELKSTRVEKNKVQAESKDELKSTRVEKTNYEICWACREPNHSIKQCRKLNELKSTRVEKTNYEICWACREPNHSIKQCRKLKSLSKDEEVCFFCAEIGHSLGKCSVYKAGGGRLGRCLFCNLHGHFSYNCPGHRYFQGAVAGGKLK